MHHDPLSRLRSRHANFTLLRTRHLLITALMLLGLSAMASAEPTLQLYIEGADYDPVTETWTHSPPGSSNGEPFRLWVIANTDGGSTMIHNVRLAASYTIDAELGANPPDVKFTFTPTTTAGLGGFTDPSTPDSDSDTPGIQAPELIQYVDDGSQPILGDGRSLPNHGQFGEGTVWQEFALGDMGGADSPIADFISSFPSPGNKMGQINVYDVVIESPFLHPLTVHFDVYDTIIGKNKAKAVFAPFSHDGEGEGGADATATVVPAPGGLMLLLVGSVCGVPLLRRRRSGPDVVKAAA